jgi:hypothetical protein
VCWGGKRSGGRSRGRSDGRRRSGGWEVIGEVRTQVSFQITLLRIGFRAVGAPGWKDTLLHVTMTELYYTVVGRYIGRLKKALKQLMIWRKRWMEEAKRKKTRSAMG